MTGHIISHHQSFSNVNERVGLAVIATAGLSSALSTSALLAYIVWNTFLTRDKSSPLHRGIRSFTRSSLGCYLFSLLFCDLLQGIAFSLNYRWAVVGEMTEDGVCAAQGVVSEIGDLGAAIWSIAIGVHTFFLLFFVKKPHPLTAPIVLVLGWTILIVLPIIGPTVLQTSKRGFFYGLSGAWCWIGTGYPAERLIYLYMWIFTALGSSFVMYTLIYLRFSNFITADDNGKLSFSFRHKSSKPVSMSATQLGIHSSQRISTHGNGCFDWGKTTQDVTVISGTASGSDMATIGSHALVGKHLRHVARRLMWYPILYTLVVVPVSVCRMGVLAGWRPPFGLLVFAGVCFGSSGVSNVILFITTRHTFIKQVANSCGTRVRVTTQRITIREDSGLECVELDDIKCDPSGHSSAIPKSPYFPSFEDTGSYTEGVEEKATFGNQRQNRDNITVEGDTTMHVTVVAM